MAAELKQMVEAAVAAQTLRLGAFLPRGPRTVYLVWVDLGAAESTTVPKTALTWDGARVLVRSALQALRQSGRLTDVNEETTLWDRFIERATQTQSAETFLLRLTFHAGFIYCSKQITTDAA